MAIEQQRVIPARDTLENARRAKEGLTAKFQGVTVVVTEDPDQKGEAIIEVSAPNDTDFIRFFKTWAQALNSQAQESGNV